MENLSPTSQRVIYAVWTGTLIIILVFLPYALQKGTPGGAQVGMRAASVIIDVMIYGYIFISFVFSLLFFLKQGSRIVLSFNLYIFILLSVFVLFVRFYNK